MSGTPDQARQSARVKTPWYRRISFWRAIAGMAITVAVACLIITLEIFSQYYHQRYYYRHRLVYFSSQIHRMHEQIARAGRQIAKVRREGADRELMNRILAAHDVHLIRFQAIAAAGRSDGTASAGGFVASSAALRAAVLELNQLPRAPAGRSYELWWILYRHAAVQGASFAPDAGGNAIVALRLPARDQTVTGAFVSLQPKAGSVRASGEVMLKGGDAELTPVRASPQKATPCSH